MWNVYSSYAQNIEDMLKLCSVLWCMIWVMRYFQVFKSTTVLCTGFLYAKELLYTFNYIDDEGHIFIILLNKFVFKVSAFPQYWFSNIHWFLWFWLIHGALRWYCIILLNKLVSKVSAGPRLYNLMKTWCLDILNLMYSKTIFLHEQSQRTKHNLLCSYM